jgi:hypothetical protein
MSIELQHINSVIQTSLQFRSMLQTASVVLLALCILYVLIDLAFNIRYILRINLKINKIMQVLSLLTI